MTVADDRATTTASELEIPARVAGRADAADSVVAFELEPVSGSLPEWSPGAHIDVLLPSGTVRQYSLCSSPSDLTSYRIAVLREPDGRGGSVEAHEALTPGATVTIRGPRNNFELTAAQRYVFVAGGIGITPILSMVAAAAERGADWKLYYGGRTATSMAFREELSLQHGERVHVIPQDVDGLLDVEGIVSEAEASGALIYCCGPASLLEAMEARCAELPRGTLRVERFEADESVLAGPADEFEVELASSGMTLTVPADKSILDVISEAGIEVMSSCEEGICGTCETIVLDGQPDHRDLVMEPEDHDAARTMQICVSRCKGKRLVLDV